jgi:putative DNA primase/helicase
VAIAFDANNLGPVAIALRKRYRNVRILVCADDDRFGKCKACGARIVLGAEHLTTCPSCGQDHGARNTGVDYASSAALEVGGAFASPVFADDAGRAAAWLDDGAKLTDYNDLHVREGLHVVRAQIEGRIGELGWGRNLASASSAPVTSTSAGQGSALRVIESLDALLSRFALIYGLGGSVFDRQEHVVITLQDMAHACLHRALHRAWMEHPKRVIVRPAEVDFDPACTDPAITCNLWAGWPTAPQAGKCDKLLELLRHMCSEELFSAELYKWVLRWLAYPIQHPGAKMKTTLVLHGPQGTGKNLFFEAVMAIYGPYGRVIDQASIEDKFNDWASRKLFLIADEVVARSDLFHVKNKLKAFITGEWIRINPKNLAARDERNHVNMVFLSNEPMPVALDEDDRRHAVIWTPGNLPQSFYDEVLRELEEGGAAALHDYLLHFDLGDFTPGTRPPSTDAKDELINLGRDSTTRFYLDLASGELPYKLAPALTTDVYRAYKAYCNDYGLRAAPLPKLLNALHRRHGINVARKRYYEGAVERGPHAVLMLGDQHEAPSGISEKDWIGSCVEAFRSAMKDARGAQSP